MKIIQKLNGWSSRKGVYVRRFWVWCTEVFYCFQTFQQYFEVVYATTRKYIIIRKRPAIFFSEVGFPSFHSEVFLGSWFPKRKEFFYFFNSISGGNHKLPSEFFTRMSLKILFLILHGIRNKFFEASSMFT